MGCMLICLLNCYLDQLPNNHSRFLLASLHMKTLLEQATIGHLKEALDNLPQGEEGLDDTYRQAVERIRNQTRGLFTRRVLS